jgi:cellulose synthase operon protein C
MLKVECDSCKASYPIDERRVPPAGLKMRCPKCGHSFLVTNPAGSAPAAGPGPQAPTVTGAAPQRSAAAAALKKTMVGVGGAPPPPPAPRPAPGPPVAPPPVAAPAPSPSGVPRESLPSDFPAALASLDEDSLPVVATGLPVAKPRAPGPAGAPPPPRRAPSPPTVRAPGAARPPAGAPAALPVRPGSSSPLDDIDLDLPVVSGGAGADLPAIAREVDLPAVAPGGADLPAVARGADLPAAKPAGPKPAAPRPAPPRAAPAPIPAPQRARQPEDFDLPVVAADLPARPPAAARAAAPPRADAVAARAAASQATFGGDLVDLPVVSADLPAAAASLPVVAADLPIAAASLPVVAAELPSAVASLPVVAASLPVPAASLPVPAASLPAPAPSLPPPISAGRGFGEIELPGVSDSLPDAPRVDPKLVAAEVDPFGGFGEIDLPRDASASLPPAAPREAPPPIAPPPPPVAHTDPADFGDIELGEVPPARTRSSPRPQPPSPSIAPRDAGGMAFGEVDLGASDSGGEAGNIGVEASAPLPQATEAPLLPAVQAAATARVSLRPRALEAEPSSSKGKWIGLGLAGVLALAGGALQLTPYGAFGYLFVGDKIHAGDYDRATAAAVAAAETAFAPDTFDAANGAVSATYAAHARTPRARALAAYAAFVDLAAGARFGADPARVPRAKQVLADLLPPGNPPPYLDAALAAQAADAGELDKASQALKAVAGRYAHGPIAVEVALLQGNVELAAGDAAAAATAFAQALDLSKRGPAAATDARAHFGLARAYDRLGKAADAQKEIDATLALSPAHPGALILRAHRRSATVPAADALRDLTAVLEGPAKAHASTVELSAAYAAKAWVTLQRGGASEARDTFEQAVKLDPRNVDALDGEGRLLMNEGRYTEALARFDTALQVDANAPDVIADDAEAKVALERLADAKQQLVAARGRFPKNLPVMLLLAKTEEHLGNVDAAETILKGALSLVDPSRDDALLPYVAMSELLSARGRLGEARDMLDDAKKKLPPSATLERAFGDISELQGDYEGAIGHYKAATAEDPRDVLAHFRLGVALRRVRRFDEASAELDQVAAVDKDYPGLSLERGVLYEESGDVQKAIELFKSALAKAPDDPDLQLRVGSAYVAIGRPDEAIPMLQKVLDKRLTSAEAHHYMGRALMLKDGGSPDALRYLKRAVELDPNRAEFHVYLAWAANDAMPADLELAHTEVEKALALDKVSAEAYWQRGILERVEGAIDDAIKDERHALELRPSRYEAHATLAECYDQKNDPATALAEWAKAIAGDPPVAADADVPHPYWRFQYGRLLSDRGGAAAAAGYLVPAARAAEKMVPRPGWLAPLQFLTAEVLRKTGKTADAVEHYRRFLEIAPLNSPDRFDAQRALARLAPDR